MLNSSPSFTALPPPRLPVRAVTLSVLLLQPHGPSLRQRVRELAQARVRFGYRRIFMLLRREGWDVGEARFHRFIARKIWL